MNKIIDEKEYLGNILKDGAEKASAIAHPVLEETKKQGFETISHTKNQQNGEVIISVERWTS